MARTSRTPVDSKVDRTQRRHQLHSLVATARTLACLAVAVVVLASGYMWNVFRSTDNNWHTIKALNLFSGDVRNPSAQNGDETYLIVGTDSRAGANSKVGAGTSADAGGARSDTVILVNIPANRERVAAVSFPRDLAVEQPQCAAWDNTSGTYDPTTTVPAKTNQKLNAVYANGGPQCLVDVLQKMSGLRINHFIGMDFSGFEKLVDVVGGVQVCSTMPLTDLELGPILTHAGRQKISGKTALNYVRARQIAAEGNGDYGRIKRQQLFISSLLRSALSNKVLLDPATLNRLTKAFTSETFVENVTTASMIDLAHSLQGLDAGKITFLTVPTAGTSTDGMNNEIPRIEGIHAIFDAIINDEPLPGERGFKATNSARVPTSTSGHTTTKQTDQSLPAVAPWLTTVRVLNATDGTSVAKPVADKLTALGYTVSGIADATTRSNRTVVHYAADQRESAATLAGSIPGALIQRDSSVATGVELILGSDFSGTVAPVPPSGTKLKVTELPSTDGTKGLPNDLSVTNAGDTTCI